MPRLHRSVGTATVVGSVPGGVTGGSTVEGSEIGALLQPSPRRVQLSNGTFFEVEQALRKSVCNELDVNGAMMQSLGPRPMSLQTPL